MKSIARVNRVFMDNAVRRAVMIHWTAKESEHTKMRAMVEPILHKYGCPLDKQEQGKKPCWSRRSCCVGIG